MNKIYYEEGIFGKKQIYNPNSFFNRHSDFIFYTGSILYSILIGIAIYYFILK